MKAVLFWSYPDQDMKEGHDICNIAEQINDVEIHEMAVQLHELVPNHLDLLYPGVQKCPKIPSDVYGKRDAREAYRLAEQILQRAVLLVSLEVLSCCQLLHLLMLFGG